MGLMMADIESEIYDELCNLGYNPTTEGIHKAMLEWVKNKSWLIDLFEKHPFYNGKLQIVFPADYEREINVNNVNSFIVWCYNHIDKEKFSLAERDTFHFLLWNKIKSSKVDEGFANRVAEKCPDLGIKAGQKMSRAIRKICQLFELDKLYEFDNVTKATDDAGHTWVKEIAHFPTFADAINPLMVQKWTVLSLHPLDYLFMSHGTSWASCHMIDIYGNGDWSNTNSYHGMYSGGTVSYMLDDSSIVFYTVDKDYDGDQFELQPKMQRNMFHLSKERIVQSRVYPQGNDGGTDIYRQFRNIVQKVWADCLEVPNYWDNVKGTGECIDNIESYGQHYRDYENFSDCNVSYLKSSESERSELPRIRVGHRGICMNCGNDYTEQNNIFCERCARPAMSCADCGCELDEDDCYYVDGETYCRDCVSWCDYCDEPVRENTHSVLIRTRYGSDYNDACEYCCENRSNIRYSDYSDRYFDTNDYPDWIETEDGSIYIDYEEAENAGYRETSDGCWYPEDEVFYCEDCEEYVHKDDWNSEYGRCNYCAERMMEEEEAEPVSCY